MINEKAIEDNTQKAIDELPDIIGEKSNVSAEQNELARRSLMKDSNTEIFKKPTLENFEDRSLPDGLQTSFLAESTSKK